MPGRINLPTNSKSCARGKYCQHHSKSSRVAGAISLLTLSLFAANDVFGQCTANAVTPQVTSQDGQEGASTDAPPDQNTKTDPDVPAGQVQPAPTGQTKGGDHGDGAGSNGSPGGTDANGADAGTVHIGNINSFDSISGFETVTGMPVGFNPGGGTEQLHHAMADPIDVVTADKKHVQVDYLSLGVNPIRMARSYHSNAAENPANVTVPMGVGWHMFYDRTLQQVSSSQIRLHRVHLRLRPLMAVGNRSCLLLGCYTAK